MTATTRRLLVLGGLVIVVLLGLGLWPRHVFLANPTPAGDLVGSEMTWTASADCSILLGEYRVETYRKPPDVVLRPGSLCGDDHGARAAVLAALVLTAALTLVGAIWSMAALPSTEPDTDLTDAVEEP